MFEPMEEGELSWGRDRTYTEILADIQQQKSQYDAHEQLEDEGSRGDSWCDVSCRETWSRPFIDGKAPSCLETTGLGE